MIREEIDKLEQKLDTMSIVPDDRRQEIGRHNNLIRDPVCSAIAYLGSQWHFVV
jgi:hypothetical protein